MKEYLIALRGSWSDWNEQSPSEMQECMLEYKAWVDELRKKKIFKYGLPLSGTSRKVEPKQQKEGAEFSVVDGPYLETKEALTGLFVIEADSLDAAMEMAMKCPALSHGESVEVLESGSV